MMVPIARVENVRLRKSFLAFLVGGWLMLVFSWSLAVAQDRGLAALDHKTFSQPAAGGQWTIVAQQLSHDQHRNTYTGEGDVHIYSGDRSLWADWAQVNLYTRKAELRGNVKLRYGEDWLEGSHVFWDLDEETGTVDDGLLFASSNRFYISGQSIEKTGPSTYTLEKGYMTSCDPDKPDWKLKYGRMKVNVDGVAHVWHTSFWARRLPFAYFPFMAYPVDTKRKSGFLMPWGGFSDFLGFGFELPFFWAVREDMDFTFYGHYMAERGFMGTLEYRLNHEKWGHGVWMMSYLSDQADKGHLSKHGYPFQTRDRYWLRSRHSMDLSDDIRARVDLDFVSDRNYLKEFERGGASFAFSDKALREASGRGILNDQNMPARESSLYVDRRFENSLLGLDVRYWDQMDTDLNDLALQRLPSLSFHTVPSRLLETPLHYTLNSSLTHYHRREGERGSRFDAYPRLYYPLHWKSYASVEPSVGGRVTSYHVDWDTGSRDSMQTRFQGDVRVNVSSRLNRVYPLSWGDYVAFQHAFRPEMQYVYSAEGSSQEKLPQFDRLDQNQFQHTVSYGFTNFFTSKRMDIGPEGNQVPYLHEFARVRLFQSFNIEPLPKDIRFLPETGRGFTTVGMRTDLMPLKYLTLTHASLLYSTEREDISHEFYLTLNSGKGHVASLNYQYREEKPVDELVYTMNLMITPSIYLLTYHNYSFEQKEMFLQSYGVQYLSGCWGLSLTYEKERDDHRIAFSINLLGLGPIGMAFNQGGASFAGIP